jgi:hypothetical protein
MSTTTIVVAITLQLSDGATPSPSPSTRVRSKGAMSSTERGRRWLAANRERRNAYMRDYRKRRAAARAAAAQ